MSLTPKEDPNLSTQSMKRKSEEDMKWERTPESHKNWYYEPVKGSSYGESSPIANQEVMSLDKISIIVHGLRVR